MAPVKKKGQAALIGGTRRSVFSSHDDDDDVSRTVLRRTNRLCNCGLGLGHDDTKHARKLTLYCICAGVVLSRGAQSPEGGFR